MAIHPIDFRYGTPEMRSVWNEENRFRAIVRAEVALAEAEARLGIIPEEDAAVIRASAASATLERAREIEAEIDHEMMAIVRAIAEVCGDAGRWIHFGATSNDILDTATALQLAQSCEIIEEKLCRLLAVLLQRAGETKHLVTAGRTHGQIGIPTTWGMRFAIWADEVARHIERLRQMRPRLLVGQLTGAVGTQASLGEIAPAVQEAMMERLNLSPVGISNQVIARDRYAEYFIFLAMVATTCDKIALEIRLMQRSEIGEVEEAFGERQVGSSTMPHKRNPIRCEQVCGLARIVRAAVEPALQNNVLWDERDLTNSAPERVLFPEASVLCDHILTVMIRVIGGLTFNEERIRQNLNLLGGINMAESVMILLTRRGMDRQEAHERVRVASMRSREEGRDFVDLLAADEAISSLCSREEIAHHLDPGRYLGTAVQQVESVIERLRGLSPNDG
ncbi:MAG: adenylosuccinate lyase [Methanoculleaceae archaeon]